MIMVQMILMKNEHDSDEAHDDNQTIRTLINY